MPIHIEFKGLWHKMPLTKKECQLFFEHICAVHNIDDCAVEILICDDKDSRKLNKEYLNSNSPTNVLSFQAENETENVTERESDDEIECFLGSLALSVETLEREAFLYGQEKKSYAKQLLVHGFAHLLGYDHSEEMELFCISVLE